jgi:hypothetical protein
MPLLKWELIMSINGPDTFEQIQRKITTRYDGIQKSVRETMAQVRQVPSPIKTIDLSVPRSSAVPSVTSAATQEANASLALYRDPYEINEAIGAVNVSGLNPLYKRSI